ncbi:SPRY domain-containing protein 3 [Homalodisca vitripennis]|nr:SPRY domain-containing protein 3 [Homalodisca vitripennis]
MLEYNGQGTSILDVGLAQAKQPLNTTSHYFEIEIVDPGENCFIAIGLTEKDYPKNRLPGWDRGSIAYHADDGKVFIGCGVGEKFGPKCYKGDTMGCGISFPVPLNQRTHNLSFEESSREQEARNERASQDVKINGSDFVEYSNFEVSTLCRRQSAALPATSSLLGTSGSHLVQDLGCMVNEETTPTGMIRELHVCDLPCEVERYRESTEFSSSTFPYACFGSLF